MPRYALKAKRLILLVALAAGALSVPARAADSPDADDAAIRENVRQMEAGWNQKSGADFARPFAADADYVVINGLYLRGRDAIEQGHQRIFDTIYKNTTLSLSVEQVRRLRSDVAIVHVLGHLDLPQGEGARKRTSARITLVMSKEKEGWKIAAFQNTQVVADR